MKKIITCIVVADGGHAKLYLNEGPKLGVFLADKGHYENSLHKNKELHSDKPGRIFSSASITRHSAEVSDQHLFEKKAFIHEIAHRINEDVRLKKIARIILVLPGKMLHEFKEHLSHDAKHVLIGELSKDLTKIPAEELPKHLEGIAVL